MLLLIGCSNDSSGGGDDEQASTCGLALSTGGATFKPQLCEFQRIIPGPACDPGPCPLDNTVAMRDDDAGHLQDVSLFRIVRFEVGTYNANAADGVFDFNGQVIDAASTVRNLLEGTIVIDAADASLVTLSFDLYFSNDLHVQGSGTIPVVMLAAP